MLHDVTCILYLIYLQTNTLNWSPWHGKLMQDVIMVDLFWSFQSTDVQVDQQFPESHPWQDSNGQQRTAVRHAPTSFPGWVMAAKGRRSQGCLAWRALVKLVKLVMKQQGIWMDNDGYGGLRTPYPSISSHIPCWLRIYPQNEFHQRGYNQRNVSRVQRNMWDFTMDIVGFSQPWKEDHGTHNIRYIYVIYI